MRPRAATGMSPRLARLVAVATVGLLGFCPGSPARAGAIAPALDVGVQQGRLTVNVREAPLGEVLRLIGTRAGVAIRLAADPGTRVTAAFVDVPLEEGIRRLVRGHPLVAVYDAPGGRVGAGDLVAVYVYAPGTDRVPGPAATPGPPGAPAPAAAGSRSPVPSVPLRIQDVRRLGQARDPAAIPALAEALLSDRDPEVRVEAAAALAGLGGPAALAALGQAITDESVTVRLRLVEVLGRLPDERARAILDQIRQGDPEAQVRGRAFATLRASRAAARRAEP